MTHCCSPLPQRLCSLHLRFAKSVISESPHDTAESSTRLTCEPRFSFWDARSTTSVSLVAAVPASTGRLEAAAEEAREGAAPEDGEEVEGALQRLLGEREKRDSAHGRRLRGEFRDGVDAAARGVVDVAAQAMRDFRHHVLSNVRGAG